MISRMISSVRNTIHTSQPTRPLQSRISLEDSSEELVKATAMRIEVPSASMPILIASAATVSTSSTLFGLSRNNTDDYIQKDLISSSWY